MIRLLMLLVVGDWHRHMWAIHTEGRVYPEGSRGDGLPIAQKYVLRCTECGNMKAREL